MGSSALGARAYRRKEEDRKDTVFLVVWCFQVKNGWKVKSSQEEGQPTKLLRNEKLGSLTCKADLTVHPHKTANVIR